ncbi:DUF2207 domain-containing protein [Candidatus Saccharibacteria bacterium]|nr:DUF2207 domain-containing protein [Candidatus Saccharibacteria bacterium]
MKRKLLLVGKLVLFACSLFIGGLSFSQVTFAGVNDFYFSDFTGDYYLSKDTEGISHLKVIESVTAEFPDYNQNKGICRQISFTNQNGNNLTLPNLTRSNIKVTRNGVSEPIYSIEKEGDYYNVCTGTDEYVLGSQTYVFEYEFEKVITEFSNYSPGNSYQELYWDTNGNGARQRFDSVTARVHFSDDVLLSYADKNWCYVGSYGKSGQERCETTELSDGLEFKAKELTSFENLTFDIEFRANSFVVPGPIEDYTYVNLIIIVGLICIACIIIAIKKSAKLRAMAKRYEEIFVKPEYQPSKEYGLAEMAEIYLGKKKSAEVAMLLEMIVQHKVELIKNEKRKWSLSVKEPVYGWYEDLLAILNNGTKPAVGDIIKIERHSATTKLITLKSSMEKIILESIMEDKLVDDNYKIGGSKKRGLSNIIATVIVMVPFSAMLGIFIMGLLIGWLNLDSTYGRLMIFEDKFYSTAFIMIVATVVICTFVSDRAAQFKGFTNKGLEASKYMEGLRLYIEMAEADRMKLLQSVEGVDTSTDGVVKLYEKLLPYAAVFGLEESWMNEMKEYCEVEEIEEPDYLMAGFATSEIISSLHSAASYATTATTMSSSGGGSSSGFSGGGGGGFSGGGGGGGGFSGR